MTTSKGQYDVASASSSQGRCCLEAEIEGAIQRSVLESQVDAVVRPILESEIKATLKPTELEADIASRLQKPSELDVQVGEVVVGDQPKKGSIGHRIGLTGPSRYFPVKEEKDQTQLNDLLRRFAVIIGTDHPFDIHVDLVRGEPTIHAVTIYSQDEQGKYSVPEHYDLLHESEQRRLPNGDQVVEAQSALSEIAKELDALTDQVIPHFGKRPEYAPDRIGNLNALPFDTHISSSLASLFDTKKLSKRVKKMFAHAGFFNQMGRLNPQGKKAMKEVAALFDFVEEEGKRLQVNGMEIKEKIGSIKGQENFDPTKPNDEIQKLEKELEQVHLEIEALSQSSQFSAVWMILQLHRTDHKQELYDEEGSKLEGVTVREILEHKGPLFRDEKKTLSFHRGAFREQMAAHSKESFASFAAKHTIPWSNRMISGLSERHLNPLERESGFALGTLFFDENKEPDGRLRYLLQHERSGKLVTQEITGARLLLDKARVAAQSDEKKDSIDKHEKKLGIEAKESKVISSLALPNIDHLKEKVKSVFSRISRNH